MTSTTPVSFYPLESRGSFRTRIRNAIAVLVDSFYPLESRGSFRTMRRHRYAPLSMFLSA